MTNELPDKAGRGDSHPSGDLLSAYVGDSGDEVVGWSVEAHMTGCADCRLALSSHVDPVRLARNRSVMLVRAATGEHGRVRRLLGRVGVPDHLVALLAATPSLRRSWLLSVVGVLAALSGDSVLVGHPSGTPLAVGGPGWGVLAPFLLIAPLTVLAGVATAFLPVFDPAHELAAAAPFPGLGLLLVRSRHATTQKLASASRASASASAVGSCAAVS